MTRHQYGISALVSQAWASWIFELNITLFLEIEIKIKLNALMLSIEIKGVRSNSGFSGLRNSDAREPQRRARERKEKLTLRPRNEVRPLWRVIWRISNNDRGRCFGVSISVSFLKYKQVRDYKKVSIICHDFQRISNVLISNNYIRCPFETVAFFNRTPWTAERRHDNQNIGTQGA